MTFPRRARAATAVLGAGVLAFTLTAVGTEANAADPAPPPITMNSAPVASIPKLTGKQTQVMLDPAFVKALGSLKLTPGVVSPATLKGGTLTFPITGGSASYYQPGTRDPYVVSSIRHDRSGISLSHGGTTVKLTDFVVDAASSLLTGNVSANGKSAALGAPLFILDGSTLKPLQVDKSAGTAVLEGTTVKLTKEAAQLLNKTFKTHALKEGLVIGTAKITLMLPAQS
jgi:hypothetical protein